MSSRVAETASLEQLQLAVEAAARIAQQAGAAVQGR